MTVASPEIDQQQPPVPAPPAEQPVFAATTPRRRRALRTLAIAAAAIAAAWLIALVLGVFGFDALPGITLPGEKQASGTGDAPAGAPAPHRRAGRLTHGAAASLPTKAKTTELRHEIARRASSQERRSTRAQGDSACVDPRSLVAGVLGPGCGHAAGSGERRHPRHRRGQRHGAARGSG